MCVRARHNGTAVQQNQTCYVEVRKWEGELLKGHGALGKLEESYQPLFIEGSDIITGGRNSLDCGENLFHLFLQ
jgi:hypothetical protein